MRMQMITYKHFIGCSNDDAVKKKYKELALKLHPDRPNGSKTLFQEMYAEYEYITKGGGDVYPIGKGQTTSDTFGMGGFTMDFDEFMRRAQNGHPFTQQQSEADRQRERQKEAFRKAKEHEAKQKRPKTDDEIQKEFAQKHDYQTKLIREIIEEGIYKNSSANSMLLDMFKVDNMGLNHFLYARWYFNKQGGRLSLEWAQTAYKNYVSVQQIKWDL